MCANQIGHNEILLSESLWSSCQFMVLIYLRFFECVHIWLCSHSKGGNSKNYSRDGQGDLTLQMESLEATSPWESFSHGRQAGWILWYHLLLLLMSCFLWIHGPVVMWRQPSRVTSRHLCFVLIFLRQPAICFTLFRCSWAHKFLYWWC